MSASSFLVETLLNLYLMVVILRLWLQLARADFYNPLSQFVVKITQPVVGPLRRVIPSIGKFDTATFVFALVIACLKIFITRIVLGGAGFDPIALLVVGFSELLSEAIWLIMILLIVRAIMSWVSQGQNPMEYVLSQLTEPFLRPIRKFIPPIAGLDLSILIAIISLQFFSRLVDDSMRLIFSFI